MEEKSECCGSCGCPLTTYNEKSNELCDSCCAVEFKLFPPEENTLRLDPDQSYH